MRYTTHIHITEGLDKMGGGPVFRALAGVGTLGLSEAAQKKPFQDLGGDNPVNSMAGGPLRFIPGGAQIAALMGMGSDAMTPKAPALHTLPVLGSDTGAADESQKKLDAAAEAERVRAARGRLSTQLSSPDDQPVAKSRKFLGGF